MWQTFLNLKQTKLKFEYVILAVSSELRTKLIWIVRESMMCQEQNNLY